MSSNSNHEATPGFTVAKHGQQQQQQQQRAERRSIVLTSAMQHARGERSRFIRDLMRTALAKLTAAIRAPA